MSLYIMCCNVKLIFKFNITKYIIRVAVEPPKSIGMSTKGKTIRVPYEGTRCRVSNNKIKTHATSS